MNEDKDLDARFVEQEHRFTHIAFNLWKYRGRQGDPRRTAAVKALVSWLAPPSGGIALGASLIGVATLLLMYKANTLLSTQNKLLTDQNHLVQRQNRLVESQSVLMESERRSTLIVELSSILDRIAQERGSKSLEPGQPLTLSNPLIGRIRALSRSLRPYRYLRPDAALDPSSNGPENEPSLSPYLSPERGQLLITLLTAELDMKAVFGSPPKTSDSAPACDFSNADLDGAFLEDAVIDAGFLPSASLRDARLSGASLNGAILHDAQMKEAELVEAQLRGTKLANADLSGIHADRAKFVEADLNNASLRFARLEGADFEGANLTEADLQGARLNEAQFHRATLSGVNFEGAHLEGAVFSTLEWLTDKTLPPRGWDEKKWDFETFKRNGDTNWRVIRRL